MITRSEIADYAVPCYGGKTRMQSELQAAFTLVADRAHWKNPVSAQVRNIDVDLIRDAVVHFTGSVPWFRDIGDGSIMVTAAGYYNTIGA
jgi:hypothetical protein